MFAVADELVVLQPHGLYGIKEGVYGSVALAGDVFGDVVVANGALKINYYLAVSAVFLKNLVGEKIVWALHIKILGLENIENEEEYEAVSDYFDELLDEAEWEELLGDE